MKLKKAVEVLTALAQESRLKLFRLLVRQGPDGLCAGDLAVALKMPKPTLSFHLKELCQAGLIASEKNGRSITYRLRAKGVQELMNFLMEDCCQGQAELCCTVEVEKCC